MAAPKKTSSFLFFTGAEFTPPTSVVFKEIEEDLQKNLKGETIESPEDQEPRNNRPSK